MAQMFDEKSRALAMKAMDRLMAHPISNPFKEPIVQGEEPPKYFEIVQKPQYLKPIRQKLADNGYETVKDWLDDVGLVWSNVELFYGASTEWAKAASESRRLFEKEKRLFDEAMIGKWCGRVYELRTAVTDLMTQPPGKVKQFAEKLGSVRVMKQSQTLMSEKELQDFITAGQMLSSDEDHREMIKILTNLQPELENGKAEIFVDVTKLNLATVGALKDYMRAALEKQGMKYPE